jgi:3-hydroxyacyl-[acyl-carrier-protein] dehydratase
MPEGSVQKSIHQSENEVLPRTHGGPTLVVHSNLEYQYPIHLDVAAIEQFIPHRSPMRFAHQVTVLAHNHFHGQAFWLEDSFVFQGHFDGQPLVPGVMIIEAAAQIAGVGLLAGDPVAKPKNHSQVGLLAGVRKCYFKRPVSPGLILNFDLRARQMGDSLANISGEVSCEQGLVATLEFAFVQTHIDKVKERL